MSACLDVSSDKNGSVTIQTSGVMNKFRLTNLVIPVNFTRLPATQVSYCVYGRSQIEFTIPANNNSISRYCECIQRKITSSYDRDFRMKQSMGYVIITSPRIFSLDLGIVKSLLGFSNSTLTCKRLYKSEYIDEDIFKRIVMFLNGVPIIYLDNMYSIPKSLTYNMICYNDSTWLDVEEANKFELQLGYSSQEVVPVSMIEDSWTCEVEFKKSVMSNIYHMGKSFMGESRSMSL